MATYIGTTGNDVATNGYDYLYGADGNDFLAANATGYDVVEGGRGNDFVYFESTNASTYGAIYGGDGNDFVMGFQNNDFLYGGEGSDFIVGGRITQFSGSITPQQYGVASGNDYIEGGNGADALYGLDGNDIIYGGDGNDTGVISGVADNSTYSTNTSTTTVAAGLFGGAGNDYLDGGRGNDYLDGGADSDTLFGGDGNDIMIGGAGADFMAGGAGSDTYEVDNAGDLVGEFAGGSDIDSVYSFVDYSMPTGVEYLVLNGTARVGTGNSADNYIYGNASQNVIEGGAGYDVLTGGAGSDIFVVRPGWGVDYVTDFTPGTGTEDAILFSKTLFTSFDAVMQNSAQVGADTYIGDGLGDTLVLANVNRAALSADDFAFF